MNKKGDEIFVSSQNHTGVIRLSSIQSIDAEYSMINGDYRIIARTFDKEIFHFAAFKTKEEADTVLAEFISRNLNTISF